MIDIPDLAQNGDDSDSDGGPHDNDGGSDHREQKQKKKRRKWVSQDYYLDLEAKVTTSMDDGYVSSGFEELDFSSDEDAMDFVVPDVVYPGGVRNHKLLKQENLPALDQTLNLPTANLQYMSVYSAADDKGKQQRMARFCFDVPLFSNHEFGIAHVKLMAQLNNIGNAVPWLKLPQKKIPEETLEKTTEETPEETPAKTPEDPPAKTTEETPEETPAKTTEDPPAKTPEETPEEPPAKTPEEPPAKTPEETPEETLEDTQEFSDTLQEMYLSDDIFSGVVQDTPPVPKLVVTGASLAKESSPLAPKSGTTDSVSTSTTLEPYLTGNKTKI